VADDLRAHAQILIRMNFTRESRSEKNLGNKEQENWKVRKPMGSTYNICWSKITRKCPGKRQERLMLPVVSWSEEKLSRMAVAT
jgi:hypothetical protein